MNKIIPSLIIFLVFITGLAAQHDAHEHGIAELHIHVTQQEIEMELHMPGADFIGFEHTELSEEEEEVLHEKIEMIESLNDLVSFRMAWFRKAGLELIEVHEGHDEEDEHDDHESHDEEDEHDDHEGHDEEHGEYVIEIHYSYEDQKHLRTVDFSELFNQFPTLEEIDWILISDSGQEAGHISVSEPRIRLR